MIYAAAREGSSLDLLVHGDPDVHVIVMMRERLHDARGPSESGVGADEDELRSCGNEVVD